jgi:hypothetical protein
VPNMKAAISSAMPVKTEPNRTCQAKMSNDDTAAPENPDVRIANPRLKDRPRTRAPARPTTSRTKLSRRTMNDERWTMSDEPSRAYEAPNAGDASRFSRTMFRNNSRGEAEDDWRVANGEWRMAICEAKAFWRNGSSRPAT